MRTVEMTYYQYDELSDDAKEVAIGCCRFFNTDHEWRDEIYEDAAMIGLKITSFDDHNIEGNFTDCVGVVCSRIMGTHGRVCETYKTVQEFYRRRHAGSSMGEEEFLGLILEEYRIMLANDYEYFSSDEAVIETIRANEYEFTEAGEFV